MIHKILTATPHGFHAKLVEIETDVSNGLPATIIVGLPDTIVQESRERVRSAIRNSSFQYPVMRVSINLAPGNIPKIGSHFDLPMALSILLAGGLIEFDPSKKMFVGELALDGRIRPCSGVLSMVLAAKAAGLREVFVPVSSLQEAMLVEGLSLYGVENLSQVIEHLAGRKLISNTIDVTPEDVKSVRPEVDFAEINGQLQAKRALLISASGFHNIRMIGSPGSGKTMLSKALAGILPDMSREEVLETTNIHSLAGLIGKNLVSVRPFRAPHHTASSVALIGGGAKPKPGEVSLAHNGVLFLDELPEFQRNVLEVMRQPLEERRVTIARANSTITFPAKFILVTAQNPCHCGNYGDPLLSCQCHPTEVAKYNKKISGPLLDRIDLHVAVSRLRYAEFKDNLQNESSSAIKKKVELARAVQTKRFGGAKFNSQMGGEEVKKFCALNTEAEGLLAKAADNYNLSGRSVNKILKVSRTIADLDGSINIELNHLAESLQYRSLNE